MAEIGGNSVEEKVREHFHEDAERFDAIYEEKKGPVAAFIDNRWRGVVQKRLELNVQELEPLTGKKILDVGCGSGRFCIAFAQRGASKIIGVDFAKGMIDLAQRLAEDAGVAGACDFRAGSFPECIRADDGPFDASTANGFFDYVEDPVPMIKAMRELTRGRMIMSFPKASEWRVPVRRLRFWLKGTPLFLYQEEDVRRHLSDAGVDEFRVIHLDRDYLVVAEV